MEKFFKLVFYVPKADVDRVKSAVFKVGAGRLGNYNSCSWQVLGIGQFQPLKGSNPRIGRVNEITEIEEYRVETLCAENIIPQVIKALKTSHPYEEPAYELIKLENSKFL